MPVSCSGQITLQNLCVAVEATKTASFRTLQQQYGDGYMARRQDGINPVNETWAVSTPLMSSADCLAFENELIALGPGFFGWTPPNEPDEKNWILDPPQWSWTYASDDMAKIAFTLRRWYQ